jgi:hypothetical protein
MATQIAPKVAGPSQRLDNARAFASRSLIVLSALLTSFVTAATESKVVLSRLFQIPFTCIGLICINIGFFEKIGTWGWITSGISMIILEAMIAEKDDD